VVLWSIHDEGREFLKKHAIALGERLAGQDARLPRLELSLNLMIIIIIFVCSFLAGTQCGSFDTVSSITDISPVENRRCEKTTLPEHFANPKKNGTSEEVPSVHTRLVRESASA